MNKVTTINEKDLERRVSLKGIKVGKIELNGSSIKSVELLDADDKSLTFAVTDYSVLSVYGEKEPKFETKYVLKGKVKGLEVREVFDSEYFAKNRKIELDDCDTLTIEKENVEVE